MSNESGDLLTETAKKITFLHFEGTRSKRTGFKAMISNVNEKHEESMDAKSIIPTVSTRPLSVRVRSDSSSPESLTSTDTFLTEHFEVDETPIDDHNVLLLQYAKQSHNKPKMKRHRKRDKLKPILFSYSPHPNHRAQIFLTISRLFTQTILPNKVSQRIINVYVFLNKSTAMAHCRGNVVYFNHNSSFIYNYYFCDKHTGERLYCIADKKCSNGNTHCHYEMRDDLFTQQEIEQMHVSPPLSPRDSYEKVLHQKEAFEHDLQSCLDTVIGAVKWNHVRVFNASLSDLKQRRAQFNTKRRIIKMNRASFVDALQEFVGELHSQITLIPIIMFLEDKRYCDYRVEYVQIVRIEDGTDIGISYCYDDDKAIQVAGIHVNKWQMMEQHQLIAGHHQCNCFDEFESRIDDIHIGNPDDDLNRLKDMKQRMQSKDTTIQELQRHVKELQTQLDSKNVACARVEPNENKIKIPWSQLQLQLQSPKTISPTSPPAIQMSFNQYIESQRRMVPVMPCDPNIWTPLQHKWHYVLNINNIPPPPSMLYYPTVPLPYNTNAAPMFWQRTT
eukprot:175344_1